MSIKKGRFYLTFKSSLIAFFLIKFFVNYSQPFCNLTATLQSPTKEKKTYTVEEIAEQLDISKKVAYSLVKSGQFSYVRAGKAIRVSKVSFDKWLNEI